MSGTQQKVAAQIVEILERYKILDKVGYITLDNAAKIDTAVEEIAEILGLDPKKRRVRCFGHVLNLVVKAFLLDTSLRRSKAEVDGDPGLDAAQHEIWRKKGPSGKLHNLIHWTHRSDKLTCRLRALQEEAFQKTDRQEYFYNRSAISSRPEQIKSAIYSKAASHNHMFNAGFDQL